MYVCMQCQEEFSALEPACPKCGGKGTDPDFLRGIPGPDDPRETIEDWVVVLRTPDEVQARLARGYLETQGIESLVYPLEGATGLEPFGQQPIADMVESATLEGGARSRHRTMPIKVVVAAPDAPEAVRLLLELRNNPARLAEGEDLDEE